VDVISTKPNPTDQSPQKPTKVVDHSRRHSRVLELKTMFETPLTSKIVIGRKRLNDEEDIESNEFNEFYVSNSDETIENNGTNTDESLDERGMDKESESKDNEKFSSSYEETIIDHGNRINLITEVSLQNSNMDVDITHIISSTIENGNQFDSSDDVNKSLQDDEIEKKRLMR